MFKKATLIFIIGLALSVGCSQDRAEANKQTVRQMIAAINERDFQSLDRLVAADVHRYSAATPGVTVENLERFKAFLRQDLAAVPDASQEIEHLLGEDDLVAVHARYRGTQKGDFGPFPPTDKPLDIPFIAVLRLEQGKVAEMWVEWDNLNALTQLGHFSQ